MPIVPEPNGSYNICVACRKGNNVTQSALTELVMRNSLQSSITEKILQVPLRDRANEISMSEERYKYEVMPPFGRDNSNTLSEQWSLTVVNFM